MGQVADAILLAHVLDRANLLGYFRTRGGVAWAGDVRRAASRTGLEFRRKLHAARGHGSRIADVDGVERIDFANNYTPRVRGHAHPRIVGAARRAIESGSCFGAPTESGIRLAGALTERAPSFEQVRFMNSGKEAVMLAVKASDAERLESALSAALSAVVW